MRKHISFSVLALAYIFALDMVSVKRDIIIQFDRNDDDNKTSNYISYEFGMKLNYYRIFIFNVIPSRSARMRFHSVAQFAHCACAVMSKVNLSPDLAIRYATQSSIHHSIRRTSVGIERAPQPTERNIFGSETRSAYNGRASYTRF